MRLPILALTTLVLFPALAAAQDLQPRFGAGFDAVLAPPGQDVVPEGFGIGLRARAAIPVNADLSFAAGVGIVGFVLSGQDDARYLLNPQISGILTLPRARWAGYFIGGFGGMIPLSNDPPNLVEGGFTVHGGIGWALPLSETSLYVEIDPSLVIGESSTTVVLPLRAGVIF